MPGIVRLVDAVGEGTVTVELNATGQRITFQAERNFIDLVGKAEKPFGKGSGKRKPLFDVRIRGPEPWASPLPSLP